MISRSIYIGNPAYLKCNNQQMVITCPESKAIKGQVPIEDLGVLMLDHFQITLSHQLIQLLMENKVLIISCSTKHMPHGIMLPLYGHSEHSDRVKFQLEASEPLKKQLWKQTIESKIGNQFVILKRLGLPSNPMLEYLSNIKSGDSTNMEGIAAQYYWKQLFGIDFIRERFGDEPNNFLNYGYSILRSFVARAIVETGLLPVLGIFHKNKYNPYCLADDIMEPYRPMIDWLVLEWLTDHPESVELNKEFKAHILQMATMDIVIDEKNRPLMNAIKITCSSLYKCYTGEKRSILYPTFL